MALLDGFRAIFRWVSLNHQVNITYKEKTDKWNLLIFKEKLKCCRKNMKIMVEVLKWTSLLCGAMNGWSSIMIEATITLLSLR